MLRSLQRVKTSGEKNNCLVNALATTLLVYFHTNTYEGNFIKALDFDGLREAFKEVNHHEDIFGETKQLDAQKQILEIGKALRRYGVKKILDDGKQSETLKQILLAAFEDYCRGKSKDNFRDDTFDGMKFVTDQFKLLHPSGAISEKQIGHKKNLLEKWWHKPYEKQKDSADSKSGYESKGKKDEPGGYQLYALELAKDGVQLSPQIGSVIAASLRLNLTYFNESFKQIGKPLDLVEAFNPIDAPCITLFLRMAHWEACLPAEIVEAFNSKCPNAEKLELIDGALLQDKTYLNFLTEDQQQVFKRCLDNDKSHDSEHIKFGRAFAACYDVEDKKEINKFAAAYEERIKAGDGRLAALATGLFDQIKPDPDFDDYFDSHSIFGDPNLEPNDSADSGISCDNSSVDSDSDCEGADAFNRSISVLDKDRFVQGFVVGAFCGNVPNAYLIEFAKIYARAVENDNGPVMEDDVAIYDQWEHGQGFKTHSFCLAEELVKTLKKWQEKIHSDLRCMYSKHNLFQTEDVKIKVFNKIQVSADDVTYQLNLENGLEIKRSAINSRAGCPGSGQTLVKARRLGVKNKPKPTVQQACDAIAMVFRVEWCNKFGKEWEKLTDDQRTITITAINPPAIMEVCKAALLKAGFTKVDYELDAKNLETKDTKKRQPAEKNNETLTENPPLSCHSEAQRDMPSSSPLMPVPAC